jgi:hypothetical protein
VNVLIDCEFSARVRDEFRARGHNAWSCDLLPCEGDPAFHIQGDAVQAIRSRSWDLMIAHPPCTFLTNSGVRWLYKGGRGRERDPVRWKQMQDAANFFDVLLNSPIPHIAVENPIPHRHAQLRPHSQIIQPWQFGHGEVKATCLWLKNLPKLVPTNIVEGREARVHRASPGPDRWKERSRTLPGIAAAMAEQWGSLSLKAVS